MSAPTIHAWPILSDLAAFRKGTFEQRAITLSKYRDDRRVPVGACPGLSLEWIRRHARHPNESAKERIAAIDRHEVWEDAADYTAHMNDSFGTNYAHKIREYLLLEPGTVFSSSDPITQAKDVCTFFDPNNKYAIANAHLKGVNTNHMCASFSRTHGRFFKTKELTLFDPNFGEFVVELSASQMKTFLKAWCAQFASYVRGRDGKKIPLTLERFEVVQLKDVVGTRARGGTVLSAPAPA